MFQRFLYDQLNVDNAVEYAHSSILTLLAGLGKSVHKGSLYKEFGRYSLMVQCRLPFSSQVVEYSIGGKSGLSDDVLLILNLNQCWLRQFLDAKAP